MYKGFDPHAPYFRGVAMALIIAGAAIFAVGGIEWITNFAAGYGFAVPSLKMIGGLIVVALGYIHLELELIRISRK